MPDGMPDRPEKRRDHTLPFEVGGHILESADGKFLALVALPMSIQAFIKVLEAGEKASPGAVVKESRRYTIRQHPSERDK